MIGIQFACPRNLLCVDQRVCSHPGWVWSANYIHAIDCERCCAVYLPLPYNQWATFFLPFYVVLKKYLQNIIVLVVLKFMLYSNDKNQTRIL